MSSSIKKRARVLRVRAIEHRIAQAKLSLANREVLKISDVQDRIRSLQAAAQASVGSHTGPMLRSGGEMQLRLANAQEALARSKVEAEAIKQKHEKFRSAAHQREESATRLHDRARSDAMNEMIRRQDAARPGKRKPKLKG